MVPGQIARRGLSRSNSNQNSIGMLQRGSSKVNLKMDEGNDPILDTPFDEKSLNLSAT